MPVQPTADQLRIAQIFFPSAFELQTRAIAQKTRFVHYTSADSAIQIFRSKEVWMRKSSCMNDFMEVQHGLNCLSAAYNKTTTGERFKAALNHAFDGISTEIETLFNGWMPHFQADTYFSCVSEHSSLEDRIGRLSMWRAYGVTTGVAIVMNNAAFLNPSDALGAYTSPVGYLRDQEFERELEKIASNIEAEATFLASLDRESVKGTVFAMLRFAALCTKHPGFREEQEWRVVFSPTLLKSDLLVREIRVIDGVPQPIYKIPLRDIPDKGLVGIEIPQLVERVIIGPTQYPSAIREAFVDILREAGVQDAEGKVFVSDIPLRR